MHQALTLPFTPGSESTPTHAHVHTYVSAHALVDRHRRMPCCWPHLSPWNLPSPLDSSLLEQQRV